MLKQALLCCLSRALLTAGSWAVAPDGWDDSLALFQSRMKSGMRPTDTQSSDARKRCATPREHCLTPRHPRGPPGQTRVPNVQLVITRSQGEDLRWLDTMHALGTVVYNRNGLDELLPTPRQNLLIVRQEQDPVLSKLGPQDGMLRHIVENYDQLPEVVLFLEAWPFASCAGLGEALGRAIMNVHNPYDVDFIWHGALPGLVPLSSSFVHYDAEGGRVGRMNALLQSEGLYPVEESLELYAALAFKKICNKLLQKDCSRTIWLSDRGQWVVTRQSIRETPKEIYEHMMNVSAGSHPQMKEIVMEALWPSLWGFKNWYPGMLPARASPAKKRDQNVLESVLSMGGFCTFATEGGPQKECEEDAGFCLFSKLSGDVSSTQGLVEVRPHTTASEFIGICPFGYVFDDGSSAGGNEIKYARHGQHAKATIEECAQECNNHTQCQSFEWSAKTKACNLKTLPNPSGPRDGDGIFCRSSAVPASEVAESPPEKKVPDFLTGKIRASEARQVREAEMKTDLVLRVSRAQDQDPARQLDRQMRCSSHHLPPPALALVGKTWRLQSVGHPHYLIQMGTHCLADPETSGKHSSALCSASDARGMKWELKTVSAGNHQLVSEHGHCLAKRNSSVSMRLCDSSESEQLWQLDLARTGILYDRLTLQTTEAEDGKLQMQCTLRVYSQEELAKPAGLNSSQVVPWRLLDASAEHGDGAYLLSRGGQNSAAGSFLGCKDGKARLQSHGLPWRLKEGPGGGVAFEAETGEVLKRSAKDGSLLCVDYSGNPPGAGKEFPDGSLFALGVPFSAVQRAPQASTQPIVQLAQQSSAPLKSAADTA